MSSFVADYTLVIRKLWKEEAKVRGAHRDLLGHAAHGIARFLRCHAKGSDRDALLALADQAEQVSQICFEYPVPRGQA